MSERGRAWLVVVVTVALLGGALVFLRTGGDRRARPDPGPLASPAATPGVVGGLLPDVTLRSRNGTTSSRSLRPAVLMLTKPDCACVEVVRQVVEDATPAGVVTYVVMAGDSRPAAERLAAQAGGDAGGLGDEAGVLAATYGLRSDAALVLVRRDGVVTQVVAGVAPSLQLGAALRALVA